MKLNPVIIKIYQDIKHQEFQELSYLTQQNKKTRHWVWFFCQEILI